MTPTSRRIGLIVWLIVCFAAAGLGSFATTPEISGWFQSIAKPRWNPPNWIFGPVWTTLYAMMAVAAWLIWKTDGWRDAKLPLTLFVVQLLLNIAWSWIFFNQHQPGLAFLEIMLLWIAIAATNFSFFRRSLVAGWLLVPYLAWVTFAAVLNFAIWQVNVA